MWAMLCARGKDLALEWRDVRADDRTGSAHWEPRYTFSATGRPVHNVIDAEFSFRDGRIAAHVDRFDLWRWSRMALGAKGTLLGWSPQVSNAVRRQARRRPRRLDRPPRTPRRAMTATAPPVPANEAGHRGRAPRRQPATSRAAAPTTIDDH